MRPAGATVNTAPRPGAPSMQPRTVAYGPTPYGSYQPPSLQEFLIRRGEKSKFPQKPVQIMTPLFLRDVEQIMFACGDVTSPKRGTVTLVGQLIEKYVEFLLNESLNNSVEISEQNEYKSSSYTEENVLNVLSRPNMDPYQYHSAVDAIKHEKSMRELEIVRMAPVEEVKASEKFGYQWPITNETVLQSRQYRENKLALDRFVLNALEGGVRRMQPPTQSLSSTLGAISALSKASASAASLSSTSAPAAPSDSTKTVTSTVLEHTGITKKLVLNVSSSSSQATNLPAIVTATSISVPSLPNSMGESSDERTDLESSS
jgi:Transcription initiation factor IID, 18kD subunit